MVVGTRPRSWFLVSQILSTFRNRESICRTYVTTHQPSIRKQVILFSSFVYVSYRLSYIYVIFYNFWLTIFINASIIYTRFTHMLGDYHQSMLRHQQVLSPERKLLFTRISNTSMETYRQYWSIRFLTWWTDVLLVPWMSAIYWFYLNFSRLCLGHIPNSRILPSTTSVGKEKPLDRWLLCVWPGPSTITLTAVQCWFDWFNYFFLITVLLT